MTNRAKAISWWSTLTVQNKIVFKNWYTKEHFTAGKNYTQLTGREIEIIWKHFKNSELL